MEGWTSLADYVARMKPGQEAIYILVGDDAAALALSPQLEGFRARGIEALLLSDHRRLLAGAARRLRGQSDP